MPDPNGIKKPPAWPVKFALLLIFVFAAGIRYSYFQAARCGSFITPDSPGYLALAESLRNGVYATEMTSGAPGGFPADLQRPPGYSFFLLLLNPISNIDQIWTALAQSILGGVFAVALASIICRLANNTTGIFTGILYSVDWVTIIHTPIIMADWLYSVVLTLAVILFWLYLRTQRANLSGLAGLGLGIAALIKPVAQVQLLTFILAWFIQTRRQWSGLVFLLTFTLCVAPWMMRNYYRYGIFTLSTIPTVSVYFFTAPAASENLSGRELDARVKVLDQEVSRTASPYAERERLMREEGKQNIRDHWFVALKQAAYGFLRTCFGTGRETLLRATGTNSGRISPLFHTYIPLVQIGLLYGFAVIGLSCTFQQNCPDRIVSRGILFLLSLAILMALLPSASPVGYSRFRVHSVPVLCLLAALGIQNVLRHRKSL